MHTVNRTGESNGRAKPLTLEERRDNLVLQRKQYEVAILKIDGAIELVNALIDAQEPEPEPPEAA